MRHPRPSRLLIVLFGAAVLFHQPLRHVAFTILRFPLVSAQSALGTVVRLPQLSRLAQDNDHLRQELTARQLELVRLRETVRHLTKTTQLTHASDGSSGLVASLIGRTLIPSQHTVLLDKGSREKVVRDGILVGVEGVVGRVVEVYPTTSLAMLLTDPNSRIAGLVERSRESGLVVGTGGRLCQFIYLDADADLTLNDRVVTAGLGGPFPKGLLIGTIVKIERDERNGQTTAWVLPAVKMSQLEDVSCLSPSS